MAHRKILQALLPKLAAENLPVNFRSHRGFNIRGRACCAFTHGGKQITFHARRPRSDEIRIQLRLGILPALSAIFTPTHEGRDDTHGRAAGGHRVKARCAFPRLPLKSHEKSAGFLDLIHLIGRNALCLPRDRRHQILAYIVTGSAQNAARTTRRRDIDRLPADPFSQCLDGFVDLFRLPRRNGGDFGGLFREVRRRTRACGRCGDGRSGRNSKPRSSNRRLGGCDLGQAQARHGQLFQDVASDTGHINNAVLRALIGRAVPPDAQKAQEARRFLLVLDLIVNAVAQHCIALRQRPLYAGEFFLMVQNIIDHRLNHIADDVARRLLILP